MTSAAVVFGSFRVNNTSQKTMVVIQQLFVVTWVERVSVVVP